MQITIGTPSYNSRREGKPWIAKVDFSDGKGAFAFGQWIGAEGEPGELMIDAEPGDVLATGQKDFRKPANSAPNYKLVNADGTLVDLSTKLDAVKAWRDKQSSAAAQLAARVSTDLSSVPTDDLIAELRRRGVSA